MTKETIKRCSCVCGCDYKLEDYKPDEKVCGTCYKGCPLLCTEPDCYELQGDDEFCDEHSPFCDKCGKNKEMPPHTCGGNEYLHIELNATNRDNPIGLIHLDCYHGHWTLAWKDSDKDDWEILKQQTCDEDIHIITKVDGDKEWL